MYGNYLIGGGEVKGIEYFIIKVEVGELNVSIITSFIVYVLINITSQDTDAVRFIDLVL